MNERFTEPLLGQAGGLCVWLTGLSGAGKSTLAYELQTELRKHRQYACVLDGDVLRRGLCADLGFSDADRAENTRRVAEVARLMANEQLVVVVAMISPFREDRARARALFVQGTFIEVFVDTPLAECQRRDPKGLYAKVAVGEITHFSGIDSPYEPPERPDVHIRTMETSVRDAVEQMLSALPRRLAKFP